ncbi:DUF1707 domain-containing protein [Nonomuraea turkmeniaca]|uniref:DUF1707 domain-containing protein n=1 Tax=Nonomuraea turkmeniaca TaxID=103838 RepID=A0A5S4FDL8_9ACTN|nr:DUF1707 domain-containing protein [Nonomuraea turkmeniaca]TMR16594.1 DUF1707 domain-containing protein [Nonomuraea turkmeniaca]
MNHAAAHLTDRDRDSAVELVQQAYADGRLNPAELEQRLELALTATSAQELEPIVGDLPPAEVVRLGSTGGRVVRTGDWDVPRRLRIDSEYGRVRLDLSQALIRHPRIDIELWLTYGGGVIILPAGASANADGVRTGWGSVIFKPAGRRRPGGLHVQITGELAYGRLTIRNSRK